MTASATLRVAAGLGLSQLVRLLRSRGPPSERPSPKLSERKAHSESVLPERSGIEPPSSMRECLRQLGFFAVLKMAEKVWGRGIWSGRRDSNPRPQPWQGYALPLSYARAPDQGAGSRRLPP
jgi:hypothetical protein